MESLEKQLIGQTVNGFRVERLLSYGRMGAVYQAQQLRPHQPVALTLFLLPAELPTLVRQQFRERFLRDGPALMELYHPRLLPLYGYGEWQGTPFLVTPYKSEGSLATTLRQRGAYAPAEVLPMLEQIAAGLEYAHRSGLVHGMLSPAHLLMAEDRSLQIAGLGLLRLLERRGILPVATTEEYALSITGAPLVTRKYLAPEYLRGAPADIRADVYALGVVLLELVSGSMPGDDLRPLDWLAQCDSILPPAFDPVLRRALADDPLARFRRVSNLLTAWAVAVEQQREVREVKMALPALPEKLFPQIYPRSTVQERPLPAVSDDLALSLFDEEPADAMFSSNSAIPWQRTPSVQLPRLSPSEMKELRLSRWRLGRPSRRDVSAVLIGGLAVGVIGSSGIALAKLLSGKPVAPSLSQIGPVIAKATQVPPNSALTFNDPAAVTQRQSLLVHLSNGDFVAYKQGCTHRGVLVNYDSQSHMLVCPAHGAVFDPAQGGRVVAGPAPLPLPQLAIQVNGDGTISAKL